MKRFVLIRHEDPSGVSGKGLVAQGVEFPDGWISLQWIESASKVPSHWQSMDHLLAVHGHGGKTVHRYVDTEPTPFRHPIAIGIAELDRQRHPEDYRPCATPDGRP